MMIHRAARAGYRRTAMLFATGACLLVSPAGAQESSLQIVERWLAEADAFPLLNATHEGVEYDQASDTVTITGATFSLDRDALAEWLGNPDLESVPFDFTVSIPQTRFTGLVADGDYYFASRTAYSAIDMKLDVDAENGGSRNTILSTHYEEFEMTNGRWARLPDIVPSPRAPASQYYLLLEALFDVSFDAAGFKTTSARSIDVTSGTETVSTYEAMRFGPTLHGDFGSSVTDRFTYDVTSKPVADGKPFSIRVTGGPSITDAYRYGPIIKALAPQTPPTLEADAPYEPVVGSSTIHNIAVTADRVHVSIGEVFLRDVGIRTPSIPILERIDALILSMQTDPDVYVERDMVEIVGAVYGAFKLGAMGITDVSVEGPDAARGKLDGFAVRALSSAGLGSLELQGLEFSGSDGTSGELASAFVGDIGFPSLNALFDLERAQEVGDVAAIMDAVPTLGRIGYEGLNMNLPGDIHVETGKALLEMGGHIGPVPTHIRQLIEGMRFPVALMDDEPRRALTDLGYDVVAGSMKVEANWDESSQSVDAAAFADMVDGGTIDVRASFGGLPRFIFENPQAGAMAAMVGLTFKEASISVEDDSLAGRLISLAAERQGTDTGTIKAQLLGFIPFALEKLQRPDFVATVSNAAETFLQGGGSLSAAAMPATPLPILQMYSMAQGNPGQVVDNLNIQIGVR